MARIIGTGGAARAIISALAGHGFTLVVAGRDPAKARALLHGEAAAVPRLSDLYAALTAITTVPWLSGEFKFVPLPALHWLLALMAGLALTVAFVANQRWLQNAKSAPQSPPVWAEPSVGAPR